MFTSGFIITVAVAAAVAAIIAAAAGCHGDDDGDRAFEDETKAVCLLCATIIIYCGTTILPILLSTGV